jgi:hypothetical protein
MCSQTRTNCVPSVPIEYGRTFGLPPYRGYGLASPTIGPVHRAWTRTILCEHILAVFGTSMIVFGLQALVGGRECGVSRGAAKVGYRTVDIFTVKNSKTFTAAPSHY